MPAGINIEYRYIIKRGKTVLRWENLGKAHHRSFQLKELISLVIDDGVFGEEQGKTVWIDRGWLTDGVQMNLSPHNDDPFVELIDPQKWSLQLVARKPNQPIEGSFGLQKSADVDNLYIFYAPDPSMLSLDVEVWSVGDEPGLIGKAVVLPYKFKHNRFGHIRLALLNTALDVVGTFRCQFLIITPFMHPKNNLSNLERCSFLYGNKAEVYIGHRGSGANKKYAKCDSDEDSESDSDDDKKGKEKEEKKKTPRQKRPKASSKVGPSVLTRPVRNPTAPSNSLKRREGQRGASPSPARGLAGNITENTLLSFMTAAQLGADYVEFDIHLTKDSVPVIAHDLHLQVPTKTIHGTPTSVQVPVNKLMEKKFRQLRRYIPQPANHVDVLQKVMPDGSERKLKRSNSFGDVEELHLYELGNVELNAPYTTLQELFTTLPEHIGFDIEIKYPESNAVRQAVDYHERNHVIDTVLKVVFDYAGQRPIFFSSFDPDICMMCNLKQPRYPVFLLTTGTVWRKYEDDRRNGIDKGIAWAKQVHLRGIAPWTRALLPNLSYVQQAHDAGLLVFTWGADNNETAPVEAQKKAGVDAIISDNILRVKPKLMGA